jgi:hypothetical protein
MVELSFGGVKESSILPNLIGDSGAKVRPKRFHTWVLV